MYFKITLNQVVMIWVLVQWRTVLILACGRFVDSNCEATFLFNNCERIHIYLYELFTKFISISKKKIKMHFNFLAYIYKHKYTNVFNLCNIIL